MNICFLNFWRVGRRHLSHSKIICISLASAVFFVFILCFLFEPLFGNDDVGLSMIAHGYGIAEYGSPNLVFSNVLWGYFVRAIPSIHGVLGYSGATLIVLIIFGFTIVYCLLKLGFGFVPCFSVLLLVLIRPVLFPQFTVNSGVCTLSGVLFLILYLRNNDKVSMFFAMLFLFIGFLIRSGEFCFVFACALPLFMWDKWYYKRTLFSIFLIIVFVVCGMYIDSRAYKGDEWNIHRSFNTQRAAFTDFGAAGYMVQRHDILERYHYSVNDILLLENWFFVDQNISNPVLLRKMLDELGPIPFKNGQFVVAIKGLFSLLGPSLSPVVFIALLFSAATRPRMKVIVIWVIFVSAIVVFGLMGRPGTVHVYLPVSYMLLIAPFFMFSPMSRNNLLAVALILAAVVNTGIVALESIEQKGKSEIIRDEMSHFTESSFFIWGGGPYEALYPLLGAPNYSKSYAIHSLGALTFAPFMNTYQDLLSKQSFIDRLVDINGVTVFASGGMLELLNKYCSERLGNVLVVQSRKSFSGYDVVHCQCTQKGLDSIHGKLK